MVTEPNLLESCLLVARITVVLAMFGALNRIPPAPLAISVPPPLTIFQSTIRLNPPVPTTLAVMVLEPPKLTLLVVGVRLTLVMVEPFGLGQATNTALSNKALNVNLYISLCSIAKPMRFLKCGVALHFFVPPLDITHYGTRDWQTRPRF